MSIMESLVLNKWVLPTAASIPNNSNSYKITCDSEPVVISKHIEENIHSNLAAKQYVSINENPSSNHVTSGYAKHRNGKIQRENPVRNRKPKKTIGKEVKSAEATKNAGKFLVFNVKSSENAAKSNEQKKKPRKMKAKYQKNVLKALKVYTAENESTTTHSITVDGSAKVNRSESKKNGASTSSTVNKLILAYGLKPTNAAAISMQNAVFAGTNSNGFNLYDGSESEEGRHYVVDKQICELETPVTGQTNYTSSSYQQIIQGQAQNTNLEEIDSLQTDCYGSTDHTIEKEGTVNSKLDSTVASVFNENNEVVPMETDQMALILQELRAIKQNQEEMKKDSDSVKRRQSYLMHYTKAISCKLEDVIDSEIEAFSLPFSTPESVQKMEQNLNQRRYSEKLEAILKRRTSTCGNVVSDLIEMVFEPKALAFFNLRGIKGQPNFKELKISKLFLKISKLSVKDYESELAKVFKKMHIRHVRKLGKENKENQDDVHMADDENLVEEEYVEEYLEDF